MSSPNIAARIRALLAKTVASGATEAEAQLAFEKAHELLRKYQLSLSDLELRAEGTGEAVCPPGEVHEIGQWLANAIAEFCDCKVYVSSLYSGRRIVYFGLLSDCQMAEWLTSALVGFIQTKALDYILETSSGNRQGFIAGAVNRLNERLHESAAKASPASSGALIVLKNQLVESAWAEKNLRLRKERLTLTSNTRSSAFAAGRAAGDSASLHKPTGRASSRLLPSS